MKQTPKKAIKAVLRCGLYVFSVFSGNNGEDLFSEEDSREILMKYHPDPKGRLFADNSIREPEYDLTIIVPVYSVEKYLAECLRSVLNQKTHYRYNVIAVDDGSTDSSGSILDSFSDANNLAVIHQDNRGLSAARNAGLKEMTSRYIMFVDSDDVLQEDAAETLLNKAYSTDADIVQGGYIEVNEDMSKCLNVLSYEDRDDVPTNGVHTGMAWGKIFKAEIFRGICFPEDYWYEDTIIPGIVTHLAKCRATVSSIVCRYRKRENSITGASSANPKCVDTFWITERTLEARANLGLRTDVVFYEHLLRQIMLNYRRTMNAPEEVKKSIFVLSRALLKKQNTPVNFKVSWKYRAINKAILDGNYRGYCALSRY